MVEITAQIIKMSPSQNVSQNSTVRFYLTAKVRVRVRASVRVRHNLQQKRGRPWPPPGLGPGLGLGLVLGLGQICSKNERGCDLHQWQVFSLSTFCLPTHFIRPPSPSRAFLFGKEVPYVITMHHTSVLTECLFRSRPDLWFTERLRSRINQSHHTHNTHTHIHKHTHTHTLNHSHTHSHTHTYSLTHSLSLSPTHTHTHFTHTHSHTCT